jgi:NAD(P)-dependent dehydrogenase (short-subunit alcohol dehydrogenase family)
MKTAMVWGARGDIGHALLKHLTEEGWTVVAIAREAADLGDLAAVVIEADVDSAFSVQSAITIASQEVSDVNLWVYAVGDIASEKVEEMSPGDWTRLLNANLSGAYLATHYSLPLLAEDAHLFYLGAISERLRLPGLSAYAAAKAGLEAFADTLRKEERRRRVTVVRPAAVATSLWDKVPMRLPAHALTPEELASRVLQAYREGHKGTLDVA